MKKIVFQNLGITIFSKLFSFLSFIYISRVLSKDDYGIYVYLMMILSLLPLLQFGSMHGAIILLPKYIVYQNCSEKEFFDVYNIFSHVIQVISAFILFLLNIEIPSYVLLVIAINYILLKYSENVIIFLDANFEFSKSNIVKFSDQILRPLVVLSIFYYYRNLDSYFIGQIIVSLITFFISNHFLSFKAIKLDRAKVKIIMDIYKYGFFVYLIWAIDMLFRNADTWFISQFYAKEELANYGFASSLALNIWLLAISYFSPYSQKLYRYVAENNFQGALRIVEKTNKNLYFILIFLSIVAISVYPIFLKIIVQKYYGTEFLFFVLIVASVFLSINNMYIYYMISIGNYFKLLRYQILILILNVSMNSFFAFYHLDIIYFSYSTIISLMIYYILVRKSFYKDISNKINEMVLI